MPIPADEARVLLEGLRSSRVANLFAQADAKFVLQQVGEDPAHFPAFDSSLDDKTGFAAYALLAAGCSLIEQGHRPEGADALEQGASVLEHTYGALTDAPPEALLHQLVGAMALYGAGHYSRAFVAVRRVEGQTEAARIIAAFLRKDVRVLIERLNEVILRDAPEVEDRAELEEWAITVAIARATALALEFIFVGSEQGLAMADQELNDAGIVASLGDSPGWWWIVRLLRIMLNDLGEASPWRVLPPHYGPGSSQRLARFVRGLAFSTLPIAELWSSQRAALPMALDLSNRGAVINLRTSAGKTRVAELAILRTLLDDPSARVFYIAPFRSLAIEVERALTETLGWMGIGISHLYGGSRVSSVDTELAAGSMVTIATPEKTRALFRAAPELFENVRLMVVDEGHLVGPQERFVRNEVFLDHLRALARATGARILLLSAVLPNAEQLAEWVTGDAGAVAKSGWKPSAERFGLARWNGDRVRIDWQGDVQSFNPSFVAAKPLGYGRRKKPFPSDKNEAVAATAIRLSAIGPAMIFSARADSVKGLAECILLGLGETPGNHGWPQREWAVFEAVCREDLDPDAIELRAARAGVICHSNRLTPQVRLALEHLMRSAPPRIIIATTTLAQGVNVGISSVIVSTPFMNKGVTITKRDFWNICGRAGRAFVDGEGKILYAIDDTHKAWQIRRDEQLARSYFQADATDPVESGVLRLVSYLRTVAKKADVPFELLLELAANNEFARLGEHAADFEGLCDWIDDELLAVHVDAVVNQPPDDPLLWVERVFQGSLAVIQARSGESDIDPGDVLSFLRARAQSSLKRVPESARKPIVSAGLPLSVALRAYDSLQFFRGVADSYVAGDGALPALCVAVRELEGWARSNAASIAAKMPTSAKLDRVREGWLGGVGLAALGSLDSGAPEISKDLYGYQLPWIVHAASQQLRGVGEVDRADALARVALLVELGVPSEVAARIFLAGVRSRSAATELGSIGLDFGSEIAETSRRLRNAEFSRQIRPRLSLATLGWLDLLISDAARGHQEPLPEFPPFGVPGADLADALHVRKRGDQVVLCTVDGRMRFPAAERVSLERVANDPRVAFVRSGSTWQLVARDPRLEPEAH